MNFIKGDLGEVIYISVDQSEIKGAPGEPGPAGPEGPMGPDGYPGQRGQTGDSGEDVTFFYN